jgi:hypothetical protein
MTNLSQEDEVLGVALGAPEMPPKEIIQNSSKGLESLEAIAGAEVLDA